MLSVIPGYPSDTVRLGKAYLEKIKTRRETPKLGERLPLGHGRAHAKGIRSKH